jgi:hypothetical protein
MAGEPLWNGFEADDDDDAVDDMPHEARPYSVGLGWGSKKDLKLRTGDSTPRVRKGDSTARSSSGRGDSTARSSARGDTTSRSSRGDGTSRSAKSKRRASLANARLSRPVGAARAGGRPPTDKDLLAKPSATKLALATMSSMYMEGMDVGLDDFSEIEALLGRHSPHLYSPHATSHAGRRRPDGKATDRAKSAERTAHGAFAGGGGDTNRSLRRGVSSSSSSSMGSGVGGSRAPNRPRHRRVGSHEHYGSLLPSRHAQPSASTIAASALLQALQPCAAAPGSEAAHAGAFGTGAGAFTSLGVRGPSTDGARSADGQWMGVGGVGGTASSCGDRLERDGASRQTIERLSPTMELSASELHAQQRALGLSAMDATSEDEREPSPRVDADGSDEREPPSTRRPAGESQMIYTRRPAADAHMRVLGAPHRASRSTRAHEGRVRIGGSSDARESGALLRPTPGSGVDGPLRELQMLRQKAADATRRAGLPHTDGMGGDGRRNEEMMAVTAARRRREEMAAAVATRTQRLAASMVKSGYVPGGMPPTRQRGAPAALAAERCKVGSGAGGGGVGGGGTKPSSKRVASKSSGSKSGASRHSRLPPEAARAAQEKLFSEKCELFEKYRFGREVPHMPTSQHAQAVAGGGYEVPDDARVAVLPPEVPATPVQLETGWRFQRVKE